MTKPFYQYIQRFRRSDEKNRDKISELAELIYTDQSFPRTSSSFTEISNYIELNDRYYSYVTTFDEVWKRYEDHR